MPAPVRVTALYWSLTFRAETAAARMNRLDLERLATFSDSVRDSTLKRLRRVPVGRENDAVLDGMMSPADIAAHLIGSDQSLFALPVTKFSGKGLGRAGQQVVRDTDEYAALIETLVRLRETRREFILVQDDDSLAELISFEMLSGDGEMDLGSMIYLHLDHEIHHRGQLVVILRHLCEIADKESV